MAIVIIYAIGHASSFNRELITDVEVFLERAAKLKGKTYKRKDIMEIHGIEIKPGMVIEAQYENKKVSYVVFPLLDGELGLISYNETNWSNIKYFVKYYLSEIVCIRDLPSNKGELNSGKILWERPKTIEYTMQEIADKLGIPVELLRIKK